MLKSIYILIAAGLVHSCATASHASRILEGNKIEFTTDDSELRRMDHVTLLREECDSTSFRRGRKCQAKTVTRGKILEVTGRILIVETEEKIEVVNGIFLRRL